MYLYHNGGNISKLKKYFNIFILILTLTFALCPAYSKDIKFIQISDLRLMPDDSSIENYQRAIERINKTRNLDFVVFTGDNLGGPNEDLLKLFIYLSRKIKVPYYIEIGDKDCLKSAGLKKELYLKYYNGYKILHRKKSFNYTVKDGNYLFVFVDGVKQHIPAKNGFYREDTVAWLDKVLTKNKNKAVIIFQHFPLFDFYENSASNLYKPELYKDMLVKHNNVLAIFSGHYMENIEIIPENSSTTYFVTAPAENGKSQYREVNVLNLGNKKYEVYSQVIKF